MIKTPQRKPKFKRCKIKSCNQLFAVNVFKPFIPCCSIEHNYDYIKLLQANKKAKEWRDEKSVMVEKLLTHKDYLNLFQKVFNIYVRMRDKDLPCISCGKWNVEEFHAGHYIASTYQYLRFNEFNVNKQCSQCNTHLRGNLIPYRIELIKRIGLGIVEQLENDRHNDLKLSIPEIKEQIKFYKEKIKLLK
jgi:hypothetical protein